jgi:DNA-binding NarL/FixJ family response regulator
MLNVDKEQRIFGNAVQSARFSIQNQAMNNSPAPVRRVFIVDDHPIFRDGLSQILKSEPDLNVCGTAESAEAGLRVISKLKPDLILVDIGLPGMNGLEFIKHVRAVDQTVKLLVVSMHDEALYADRVLRAGGDGYIMKQENPGELSHAIRDVLGGHIYVSEAVLADRKPGPPKRALKPKAQPLDQLTDSELEILEGLGQGRSNSEIARQLRLNGKLVRTSVIQIRHKLKLKTTNALVRYAVCWVEGGGAQPGQPG